MVELDRYLNEHGVQGSALERPWIPPTEYVVEGNSAFLTQFIT
ncbi:hypothetical protein ECDEC14D_3737 [Escherichia coli DEC14D]|nr:hypothetical protein ECDEC14D_3737 [Escherichia coli DEC14D]